MFDVIVIGGGVVGGLILRELTKYELDVCLLEKENDVSMGASKANSGIVHAGFDAAPNSLKAYFNVKGNKMMPRVCSELGVKYRNNGSLVVAFNEEDVKILNELKSRGEENGVEGLTILGREELHQLENNLSDDAIAALFAPSGGIVCPYELTISAIGNAMDNGAKLYTDFEVVSINKEKNSYSVKSVNGETVEGKTIINCAGLNSGKIASLVGDDYIKIGGRKGEYILLDRESGDFVNHTLFFTPTKLGKGILVTQTVDNNVLLGPTAEDGATDTETSAEGLNFVKEKASKMCKNPPLFNTITSFSGVRAFSDRHDFIIEESKSSEGVIHVAGIESPGLTASPAIAESVVSNLVSKFLPLKRNEKFNGRRKPDYFFKNLSVEEKNEIIKRDPSYGKIVCRCEKITEGEILRAIRENPPAKDVDGVKRRTRAGMGRCQGGFCQPYVVELLAKEQNKKLSEITKNGEKSYLLTGESK